MSETAPIFAPLEDEDPARPGDPFSRLRYQYGQLLGAEDFAAEQRYHVLRERLLNATLHGYGTVRGLRVGKREETLSGAVQLVCAPGLAVDALGRLIHIGQEVCLDVTGLALAPFWSDLAPPPGAAEDARTRRAYVVLSYRACLAEEVPAIAPPCSGEDAALAFSRVEDRWRLCLAAEPPPDPHPLAMDWAAAGGTGDLGARLLEFILGPPGAPPPAVSRHWSNGDEAPLLLATVDFEPVGDPTERTSIPGEPDNSPRALLPAVQTLAAMTTGLRLLGPAAGGPFRLVSVTARSEASQVVLDARFTTTPDTTSLSTDAIRVFRRDGTGAWVAATFNGWSNPGPGQALITVGEDWTAPTTYQLLLRGAGAGPLLDTDGQPLSGLDGEPPLPPGAGRDVSLVARFTP